MTRSMTVVVCHCLIPFLSACAGKEIKPLPPAPTIVQVPKYQPLPPQCLQTHPLELPTGATSEDVEQSQHELILKYEAQLIACRPLGMITDRPRS